MTGNNSGWTNTFFGIGGGSRTTSVQDLVNTNYPTFYYIDTFVNSKALHGIYLDHDGDSFYNSETNTVDNFNGGTDLFIGYVEKISDTTVSDIALHFIA